MESSFKKEKKVRLDLLTDIDTLSMVGKGLRAGICHSAKANNKYMNDYDKNKEWSHI